MEIAVTPVEAGKEKPVQSEGFGFGSITTNYMFTQKYDEENGWHDAKIEPYAPFQIDPTANVLHYAQEIFEGTKAYRRPDGAVNLFRIHDNIRRFNNSATRMTLPTVDEEEHLEAIVSLLKMDYDWVPAAENTSLYIRPALINIEASLGASVGQSYMHFIIFSPVEAHFAKQFKPISVYIEDEQVRAVRGGVGAAKTGGNYAASQFISRKVKKLGFRQVLWLDAIERCFVEEMGGMNICFVYGDTIKTPALTGTILPGITRASVIELGRDLGYTVEEAQIDVKELVADIENGLCTEAFACGTAAVIGPIGRFQ
ncbi:MAG: branched-chain amino acid aminotransferase [Chloroflexota bacterium]